MTRRVAHEESIGFQMVMNRLVRTPLKCKCGQVWRVWWTMR
jgi:hypothetical protein